MDPSKETRQTSEPLTSGLVGSAEGASEDARPGPGNASPVPQQVDVRGQFEALVGEHLDHLYNVALRLTRNRTAAEDLVQEAMLRAWRSFHTFQQGTNIRAWLYRILVNAHHDSYRKRTREPEEITGEEITDFYLYNKAREGMTLGEEGNPEISVLEGIMDTEVRESLDSLPLSFRTAVVLVDIEGFSYKEAAEIMGIPVGTVMSRLFRGRRLLQRALWEYARDRRYVRRDTP